MPTYVKFTDRKKDEHIVVLAEEPEWPEDEDELAALGAELEEKALENLRKWKETGETSYASPLTLVGVYDDVPED